MWGGVTHEYSDSDFFFEKTENAIREGQQFVFVREIINQSVYLSIYLSIHNMIQECINIYASTVFIDLIFSIPDRFDDISEFSSLIC